MSPRQILVSLAATFLLAGLVFGILPRSVSDESFESVSCGSLYFPETASPFDDTSIVEACATERSDMKPYSLGALGLAAISLIVAFTASPDRPTNSDGTPKPSIWR